MSGAYTIPKLNLPNIIDLLTILPGANTDQLNKDLLEICQCFIMDFYGGESFSFGKTKKDFESIRNALCKIKTIKNNNRGIEEYFILKSAVLADKDPELYNACWTEVSTMLSRIDKFNQLFDFYCDTFQKSAGRYKNTALSHNKAKNRFVSELAKIYKCATGKKPTPTGGGSIKDSEFVSFAKSVLEIINSNHADLENGHNISISFDDVIRRWAKSSQK